MSQLMIRLVVLTALLAGAAGFRGMPAPPSESQAATAEQLTTQGRIIEAPTNIRRFAPEDDSTVVDASNINLRRVFEDLGSDAALWYQHVQTLANPFFEGRSAGTRGYELAVEYVEFHMKQCGLHPAFPTSEEEIGEADPDEWVSYRQPFEYSGRPNVSFELDEAFLAIDGQDAHHGTDFNVLGPSGGERFTGPVTFVGYGIANGPDDYSSFEEDTDLAGRAALLLRYEPLNEEGTSQWAERRFSGRAAIARKFRAVAGHGAAAIILVNPPGAVEGATGLETLDSSAGFGRELEIPVIHVTPDIADQILKAGDPAGRDLMAFRTLADQADAHPIDLKDDLTVSIEGRVTRHVERRSFASANAGGVLPGRGELADEWVIIGAHMDHVGYGGQGAMPGGNGSLHPGADDNASGTAGVLILGKRLAERYRSAGDDEPLRSILFLTFGAEEAGLLGSDHYVDHPTIAPDHVSMMLNMDMIGRLRNHELMVGGTGSAAEFDEILPGHVASSGLTVASSPGGRGPSDHANFYKKRIPVLFMFTGMHREYHRPGDLAYTVNPVGAIEVLDLAESIVMDVASRPEQLTYQSTSRARRDRGEGEEGRAERRERAERRPEPAAEEEEEEPVAPSRTGASVQLGIVPAYTADLETGVLVDDVLQETSAAEGGIKPGDILLTWNGEEIPGLRQLSEFLQEHKPGDTVKVSVRRDGKTVELKITLKARP